LLNRLRSQRDRRHLKNLSCAFIRLAVVTQLDGGNAVMQAGGTLIRYFHLLAAGLFLLAAGLRVAAQQLPPLNFLTHVWRADDGLPDGSVVGLVQTPDGYLWAGTRRGGVVRFDGVHFQTFDQHNTPALSSDEVWNLFGDANGTVWINTVNGGLTAWRNGAFTSIRRAKTGPAHWLRDLVTTRADGAVFESDDGWLLEARLAADGAVSCDLIQPPDPAGCGWFCVDADGTFWCRTADGGLARRVGGDWQRLTGDVGLKSKFIGIVLADADQRIWVGTEKEIARWNGTRFENQTPTNGEPELRVEKMAFAGDRSLWVGANGKLRRCWNRQWLAEAQGWDAHFGAPPHGPRIFGEDRGGVWVIHHGEGAFYAAPDGRSFKLTGTNGLANGLVDCWLQDREQNVWLGLNRGGLVRLRPGVFQVLDAAAAGVDNYATSVSTDGDDIWVGTATGGLAHWHAGVATELSAAARRILEAPADVVVAPGPAGQIWVGGVGNGALVFSAGKLEHPFPASAVSNVVRVLYLDHRGVQWLGSEFGLFRWSEGKLQHDDKPGPDRSYVLALAEDATGRLLAGTDEGDLRRRDGGRWEVFRPQDGLPASRFWALSGDADGGVWIGTLGGGLLRFENGKFFRFTTRQGLPSNTISQILDDGRGQLWLGTRAGIVRVRKAGLLAVAGGQSASVNCVTYGRDDGLPTIECSGGAQPAAWHAADGRLWFATANGVVSVQPTAVHVNRRVPPVIIENLLVDAVAQTLPADGETLVIPPGRHYFEFHFTGLSFTAPDKVRFRWRLEGLEKNWVEGGTARSVSYSFLPPGRYTFRVLACNNDGIWNDQGATVGFRVQPFWWQTWWFKITAPGLGFGLVVGMIFWVLRRRQRLQVHRLEQTRALALERLAHQQSMERERARIAQDLHDDLGASLTHLAWLGESAGRDHALPAERLGLVAQITAKSREMVSAIDEIVWAVNPKNDSLDHLATYICEFAEQFFRNMPTRCRVDVQEPLPVLPLPSDVRHHLFLAAKEALHNVAKHADANRVWVRIKLADGQVQVMIEDDGRGFVPATQAGGDGLENMRRRAATIGAEFELRSVPGHGTTVAWKLPQNHPQG
jgi:signal transduction histidine kinase/ligand-binding sensor domain-containing protein